MCEQLLRRADLLLRDEQGATATEYAIMLVLILLVAFATIVLLGQNVEKAFNLFNQMMQNATN